MCGTGCALLLFKRADEVLLCSVPERRLLGLTLVITLSQDEAGQDVPVGPSFFWRTIEDELTTIAQYYDAPALSLRNAVYHLLREGRPGFQVRPVGEAGGRAAAQPAGEQAGGQPAGWKAVLCCFRQGHAAAASFSTSAEPHLHPHVPTAHPAAVEREHPPRRAGGRRGAQGHPVLLG